MPRRARLRIAGHPLHVIQRGVNRCACFGGGSDYGLYLALLEEIASRYACAIHAYVLMTNHVHLLLTPGEPDGISKLMKHLGQRYVQAFNKRHKRTGTLWEGRFRSCIIDSEAYLLRCQRYIELNPVRAGMVRHPHSYPWSSYGRNAEGLPSPIVVPHALYMALGSSDAERCASYCRLFGHVSRPEELQEIRDAANAGTALGRKEFLSHLEAQFKRRVTRGADGRPRKAKPGTDPGFCQTETGVCPRFSGHV